MAERLTCWYIEGQAPCRNPAEMVELAAGKPRRLCARHREGIRMALAQPGTYRVSWGRPMSERLAEAEAVVERLGEELASLGLARRVESGWEIDWERVWGDDDDPWGDTEEDDFWESERGRALQRFERAEGKAADLSRQWSTYRREAPFVRVRAVTDESHGS